MKALAEGLYIKHFQYGLGVVTDSDSERTSIDFDLHGLKKFVTSIMVVEPAEGTPPKRSRAKRKKKVVGRRSRTRCRRCRIQDSGRSMSDSLIVQFVGYEVQPARSRIHDLLCARSKTEAREFTLTIANASFDCRRARFQDAPDICSLQASPGTRRGRKSSGKYALRDYRRRTGRLPRPPLAQAIPQVPTRRK